MPDLVRRAATAVEALRPDYFERRHRLVPELAQLVGRQRSRIDAGRLAVLIHFLGRPKWTTVVSALRCLQWLYARSRRALASTSSVYWALTPANPVLRACPPSTAELPDWSELRSDEAGTATPGAIMSFFEPRRSIAASSLARPNRIIRPLDGSRVVCSLIAHPLAADSHLAGTDLPRFDQECERDASKIPDLDAVRRRSSRARPACCGRLVHIALRPAGR
jgi:hypothetical protein